MKANSSTQKMRSNLFSFYWFCLSPDRLWFEHFPPHGFNWNQSTRLVDRRSEVVPDLKAVLVQVFTNRGTLRPVVRILSIKFDTEIIEIY